MTAISSATSSSASSAVTTSSIDVASIVSQLMTVESQPMTVLNTKITSQQTVISDLGKIKGDVAALQDVLGVFEDPTTFSNLTATSTDASVVTATTGVGAVAGTHSVTVSQAAQVTSYNISGFATKTDLINLDPTNGFQITIGGTSYSTNGSKTVGGVTTLNAISTIGKTGKDASNQPASTVNDLQTWINGLNINISASLIQQNANHWVLQVAGSQQGSSNDFSLSGLITGNSFGGFLANNSAINLDPVIGFQLSVGGHTYSTLGKLDGAISGTVATLSSNTTISALADWVNGLNVNVSAAVVGSAGDYSLQLNPKNGASFTTAGLPGSYATGFNALSELVSLDQANGFQVTVGTKTYQTAGSGAIAIAGTGVGGGVTLSDLATWINNLSGANLSASVVGGAGNYSLEVNNIDLLSAKPISLSGIVAAGATTTTTLSGFSSTNGPLALDSVNGFQITVGGTTYKTTQGGTTVGGKLIPTLGTTGPSNTSNLTDLNTWITGLSTTYGLNLTTSILNSGSPYSLAITASQTISVAGINPNAVISGFGSATDSVVIDPVNGFSVVLGSNSYTTTGKKNGATDGLIPSLALNGTNSEPTLTDLKNWINALASAESLSMSAGILNQAGTYSLEVHNTQVGSTNAVSLSGLEPTNLISGFNNSSDPIVLDPSLGFSITVTRAGNSTTYSTNSTPLTSYLSDTNGNHVPRLSDLVTWINSLNGSGLNASIVSSGSGVALQIIPSGSGATVTSSGIIPNAVQSGFSSSNAAITLDAANGFQLTVGANTYSTKGTLNGVANAAVGTLATGTTLSALRTWVNGISGANLNAAIIGSGSSWQLSINENQSGASSQISTTGILPNTVSSNVGIVSASSTVDASSGTYAVNITQTAKASQLTVSGFDNLSDKINTGFSITVGNTTYYADTGNSVSGGVTTNNAIAAMSKSGINSDSTSYSTVNDLKNWINSLTGASATISGTSPFTYNNAFSDAHVGDTLYGGSYPSSSQLNGGGVAVATLTGLDYYNAPADHYLMTASGTTMTLASYGSPGGAATASQSITVPSSFTAGQTLVFDFDNLGVRFTVNTILDSTGDSGNAAQDIAKGLYFANHQPGTPGWYTANTNGAGYSLKVQASVTGVDNAVTISGLSSTEFVRGGSLTLSTSSVAARNLLMTIGANSYNKNTNDPIIDNGASSTNGGTSGTTYTINTTVEPGSPVSATVTVGQSSASSHMSPSSSNVSANSPMSTNESASNTQNNGTTTTVVSNPLMSKSLLDGGITKYTTAQDAKLIIDGVNIVRSTNTISDFVPGVNFQINANPSPGITKTANINIVLGTDNTQSTLSNLMTAYNKLINDYNAMTANANNGKSSTNTAGTFGNDPTMLSFVEGIKRRFANGATYNIGSVDSNHQPYVLSLAALGMVIQLDGTLSLDTVNYQQAISNGLRQKLIQGARIGYISSTDNLSNFIKAQSSSIGAIAQEISAENTSVQTLQKEQQSLQDRLNKIQDAYIAQYSGLNALLYQLNSTSTNLASSLSALTNMAAGK